MSNAYIKTLKDGNGNIVYPQTKTGAIYRNDNSASLDSLLDAAVYMNAEEEGVTPVTRDADTLGGYPASDYAKNDEIPNELFIITFALNTDESQTVNGSSVFWITDKTAGEIYEAYKSNKTIIGKMDIAVFQTAEVIATDTTFSQIFMYRSRGGKIESLHLTKQSSGLAENMIATKLVYEYSNKPTTEVFTLLASGWSDNTYDLGNTDSNLEIELDSSATDEMIEAWTNAKILGSATSNILTAKGDVPTIDITCIMKRTVK